MPEKTAAIYVRVSTEEQTTANQLPDCEQLARHRGYEVGQVYEEQQSAAKERPVFERMLADAHRGKFSVLVVWDLSRFGRTFYANLADVGELDRLGVRLVSVQDVWLDTTNDIARKIILGVRFAMAEGERDDLIRRTKAGMARVALEESTTHGRAARRARKKLGIGRPRTLDDAGVAKVRELRAAGRSWTEVAKAMGCSPWAAMRAAAKAA